MSPVKSGQTSLTCEALQAAFPKLFTQCAGDKQIQVTCIRAPEDSAPGSILFLNNPRLFEAALASQAAALVVPNKALEELEGKRGSKALLGSPNVELAMAMVTREFFFKTPYRSEFNVGIHPMAAIHPSAQISAQVTIGPHAVIGARVKISEGAFIGANSVIEADSQIGKDSVIHPLVYIGHSVQIGERCEVHPHSTIGKEGFGYAHDEKWNHYRIPHQGRVVLEDDVHIGAGCCIDRGTFGETRIKFGTKFDNQCHIAHNNVIGRNGLITAQFVMAGSSEIGNNFVTGGKSVVTGHIKITDNVQLAALTAVSKSIEQPGQYGGNPMQPLQAFLKTKAAMTTLPELRKQVARLMKKVFPEDEEQNPTKNS